MHEWCKENDYSKSSNFPLGTPSALVILRLDLLTHRERRPVSGIGRFQHLSDFLQRWTLCLKTKSCVVRPPQYIHNPRCYGLWTIETHTWSFTTEEVGTTSDAAVIPSPLEVVSTAAGEVILGGRAERVDAGCEEAGGPALREALLIDSLVRLAENGSLVGELAERIREDRHPKWSASVDC